jgi:hypothetical protein
VLPLAAGTRQIGVGNTLQRARERGSATEGGLGSRGGWDARGKGLSGTEFPSVED